MKTKYDILIIGAGVFGLTAAIELANRKYKVGILNPDSIPHPRAASTDINKVVRMEYGSDKDYFDMGALSIKKWREWNSFFGIQLYHEVGFLMLCKQVIKSDYQAFEKASLEHLNEKGYKTEQLQQADISKRFPVIKEGTYQEANFNPIGGYVESGLVIKTLSQHAKNLGIDIHEGQTVHQFDIKNNQLQSIQTKEATRFSADQTIVSAGANTPYLLPELLTYMKATAHPVFHVMPSNPNLFKVPNFSVFTADISNSGWYGFPFHPKEGVVKIAKHTNGSFMHPDKDDRRVTDGEVLDFRRFLKNTFPSLVNDPIVYTRKCLYTDTLDGHFWIDKHPIIKGLAVSSGGSGHAMKMGPILGEITADMIEGKTNKYGKRFKWRKLDETTFQEEQARFIKDENS